MRFPILPQLTTPRLILRKLTMEDAPLYYARIASRPEVARYMLWEPHENLSQTEDVIQRVLDRYDTGGCYRWCIALAEDDSPIGAIELLRFDETKDSCSFAYMLGSDFWKKGYGTEALQAVLRFAFEEMQINSVTADHMAANPASGAVMRKTGMTYSRTIHHKYDKSGQPQDACEYSITREQWNELHMKKLYCGGTFPFDYQKSGYMEQVRSDYRSRILGDVNLLLQPSNGQALREDLTYIGPFYFEAPEMVDTDIVLAEMKMVESCTHAIFLLDDGTCPGTITELTAAALLGKQIAVFYIRRSDHEETESPLHSPCWYPIRFCQIQNPNTLIFSCLNREEAARKILEYLETL